MANTTSIKKIPQEHTRKEIARYITIGGAIIAALIAAIIGFPFGADIGLATLAASQILWAGLYVGLGWTEVPEKEAWVIERFSKYCRVLESGISILCFPGYIDTIAKKVDLKRQGVPLFQGAGEGEMDFSDGSALLKAKIWFTILPDKVTFFVYNVDDPIHWVQSSVIDLVRPQIQQLSIDTANTVKAYIANGYQRRPADEHGNAVPNSRSLKDEARATIGIEWDSLLITGIVLPDEIKRARRRRLDGKTRAQERTTEARGYWKAIQAIIDESRPLDENGDLIPGGQPQIDRKEAERIFDRNEGLKTMRETGSNVTLVGRDLDKIIVGVGGNDPVED